MKYIIALVHIFLLSLALPLLCHAQEQEESWTDILAGNLYETGISRDQIPALGKPRYISTADASLFMDRDDIVFLFESPAGPVIYPREILVWHQIINDAINEQPASITYDPVTGGLVGYYGTIGHFKTGFGVFGPVVNNNLVLYDRSTLSLWPQLLGQAIEGRLKDEQLTPFTLLWTTWNKARKRYPKAKVLSRPTIGQFAYGRDPYGSYRRSDSYYQNGQIVYPLIYPLDKRLPPKEPVLGLRFAGYPIAVRLKDVKQKGAINFQSGFKQLVALYDRELDDARVFERTAEGQTLTLFAHENGEFYDQETHSSWNALGEAQLGPLRDNVFQEIPRYRAMWFAWSALNPGSDLVTEADAFGGELPSPSIPGPDTMDSFGQWSSQQP